MSEERHYIRKRSPSITSINANGEVSKDLDILVLQTEKSSPFQLICQIHFEGYVGRHVWNCWSGHEMYGQG